MGINNMKKQLKNLIIALAVASSVGTASAIQTDNLQNLVNTGGSVSIGDKTFSNFGYLAGGLTGFDASQIIVTASIVGDTYFLTWGGSIALASTGPAIADLLLNYTVTATAGSIFSIDQSYTGSAQPSGGAFLAVDETVRSGATIVANSHLEAGDLSDPFAEVGDQLLINPALTTVDVTKDIALAITSPNGGLVTISQVAQSFHQTSVPDGGMTVILLGVALSGIGVLRRKFVA